MNTMSPVCATLDLSLSEIAALSCRAARGAGFEWGEADEAAFASVWLSRAGIAWIDTLLAVLDTARRSGSPLVAEGRWRGPGALCPLLTGIALAAMAAERGLTGHVREALVDPVAIDVSALGGQSLGAIASTLAGRDVSLMVSLVISILMIAWVLRDGRFRADKAKLRAGLTIGLCIAAGWYFTSMFAQRLFVPVQLEAGSFVSPLADTILQIVTVTGALPDYGVGLVVGVLTGAAIAAWHNDDMRWEACDDARELSRHLLGAFLMGTGGILAFGCTIGQGVSAFSVLALSAPIVLASIALGARVGLAVLVEGSPFGFLTAGGRQPAE